MHSNGRLVDSFSWLGVTSDGWNYPIMSNLDHLDLLIRFHHLSIN